MLDQEDVLQEARKHCCTCNQRLAHVNHVKGHFQKLHQTAWLKYGVRAEKLVPASEKCTYTKYKRSVLPQLHLHPGFSSGCQTERASTPAQLKTRGNLSGHEGSGVIAEPRSTTSHAASESMDTQTLKSKPQERQSRAAASLPNVEKNQARISGPSRTGGLR